MWLKCTKRFPTTGEPNSLRPLRRAAGPPKKRVLRQTKEGRYWPPRLVICTPFFRPVPGAAAIFCADIVLLLRHLYEHDARLQARVAGWGACVDYIFACDETTGGNVLATQQSKKMTFLYMVALDGKKKIGAAGPRVWRNCWRTYENKTMNPVCFWEGNLCDFVCEAFFLTTRAWPRAFRRGALLV